jgi:hypothetical protein
MSVVLSLYVMLTLGDGTKLTIVGAEVTSPSELVIFTVYFPLAVTDNLEVV